MRRQKVNKHDFYAYINNCKKEYTYLPIQELIQSKSLCMPNRISVIDKNGMLTYEELNRESDRIAGGLIEYGVTQGELVPVVSERSRELIQVILAILKCGAVYVPIDSKYPSGRIDKIIHDTKCKRIINLSSNALKTCRNRPYQMIDGGELMAYKNNCKLPSMSISPENTAYIMYTSGSTGKPKGVKISHKAALNTLFWMNDQFYITENDRIAHKTSVSFTDSVWEIFWPLINGAAICIIDDDIVKSPGALYHAFLEYEIGFSQFVPATMKPFIEYAKLQKESMPLTQLKWIFNGGEYLPVSVAEGLIRALPHTSLANIYGMTETAIYSTFHVVEKYSVKDMKQVPIGRPITNTEVFVVNEKGELADIYEKGELCVSGISLFDGYWNDDTLTNQKFLSIDKKAIYKTGDVGFCDALGVFWYCGRKDSQVKIRGCRVELFEVEQMILTYPGIKQCAVLALKNTAGATYLGAYISGKNVDTCKLALFLKNNLPAYMIPSKYFVLNQMPLSTNKKIDRAMLAAMENHASSDIVCLTVLPEGLREALCQTLGLPIDTIETENITLDSITVAELQIAGEKNDMPIDYSLWKDVTTLHLAVKLFTEYRLGNL